MERDEITQSEFIACLEVLARLIEAKAHTKQDAVNLVRELIDKLEKAK